jgi:hypothetical protein
MIGSHHGRPSGPTSVNDASAASIASTARIGNSAAISVGTCGLTSGDERRSAAILAATPRFPLTTLPSTCMLDARYRTRRSTVPPAASMVRCHASLRATSARICSSTVTASTDAAAAESAAVNASRRSASSTTRTAAVPRETTIVTRPRRRRPTRRTRLTSPAHGLAAVMGSRPYDGRGGSRLRLRGPSGASFRGDQVVCEELREMPHASQYHRPVVPSQRNTLVSRPALAATSIWWRTVCATCRTSAARSCLPPSCRLRPAGRCSTCRRCHAFSPC